MSNENWFLKYDAGSRKGAMREGVLMKLEENEHSRYEFEVWFEYTRSAMNDIREGTMLVVPNYATTRDEIHSSVIEITSIKPIHYAIGENPEGFPGFVLEAAKNAAMDWTGQDDEPSEDTTTIRCTAIPTNLELIELKDGHRRFEAESNIPMVGGLVKILDTKPTQDVVNRSINLELEQDSLFSGGTLIRDSKVTVFLRFEEFIRLHFGIFGFTGAGKSNLLSSYIAELLKSSIPAKVILFDLMGEYTALLVDLLQKESLQAGCVIALGEQTFPGPVVSYLKNEPNKPNSLDASNYLNRVTLLPTALQKYRKKVQLALQRLMEHNRIRIFSEITSLTIWYIFFDFKNNKSCPLSYKARRSPVLQSKRKELIKTVLNNCIKRGRDLGPGEQKDYKKIKLSKELATDLIDTLDLELAKPENKEFKDGDDFAGAILQIRQAIPLLDQISPAHISMSEILSDVNDDDENGTKSSLYIITAHNPDEMRRFAQRMGAEVYEARRRSGEIRPLVSFIFDEADEFMPLDAKGTQSESKEIINILARRGRKFGLGVGIATQRARYLDTSIMAQPHTYLVSKLPRRNDREVVAEAFGVSEEMFRQTFKFRPGNWLIMSHDATGLKAIPVPIQTMDANERLARYLESLE